MSLKHSFTGDANRDFHPDSLLTRAYASILLSKAFQLLPSISNAHFKDIPFSHMAFREIETLFDNGALSPLGIEPKWIAENGYDAGKHSGFKQDYGLWSFHPDTLITGSEFQQMVQILKNGGVLSAHYGLSRSGEDKIPAVPGPLNRSFALAYVDDLINQKGIIPQANRKAKQKK